MADIAEIDDDGYGFSTGVAHYSIDGHYGQSDEALKANVIMIVETLNRAEPLGGRQEFQFTEPDDAGPDFWDGDGSDG